MPPLRHTPTDRARGERFDVTKSDVVAWLAQQPEALEWLFATCQQWLEYDNATGMWAGKPMEVAPAAASAPIVVEKRAGRPNKFDRDRIMEIIRREAPNWSGTKTLSEIHRVVAASIPMNLTSFFNVIQRLVRDSLVVEIHRKGEKKRYYAAPQAMEVEV